jgi:hypothetical protein
MVIISVLINSVLLCALFVEIDFVLSAFVTVVSGLVVLNLYQFATIICDYAGYVCTHHDKCCFYICHSVYIY